MKFFTKVPYDRLHFLWESDRWDIALKGLCIVNGSIMYFTVPENYQGLCNDPPRMDVYSLSLIEKMRWLLRKKAFEICVGRHCTYPDRKQGVSFYYKYPRWFWMLVCWGYYLPTRIRRST